MPKLRVESSREVADELELGHLRQARRLAAPQLLGHLGARQALVRGIGDARRPGCDFS